MSNLYQPSTVNGTVSSWKRAVKIEISNPANGAPSAVFSEELATSLPNGEIITTPSTSVSDRANDMSASFPLVDPTTGESLGTMTYGQLYAAMYSLYLNLAEQRDAQAAAMAAASDS